MMNDKGSAISSPVDHRGSAAKHCTS